MNQTSLLPAEKAHVNAKEKEWKYSFRIDFNLICNAAVYEEYLDN